MNHFLKKLQIRFPRLKEVEFTYSDKDSLSLELTPAGIVEIMYFHERADFENAIVALAFKLERKPIPASMGAIFISGLVDRINNCKTTVIILSRGGYSAIDAASVGLSEEEWLDKSFLIRKNHELAHFIQRKLFPENKNALKDEIKADMVGLIAAFGSYRPDMAKLFLGVEGITYRNGGRLQNYAAANSDITCLMKEANDYIDKIDTLVYGQSDSFKCLMEIEQLELESKQDQIL